MPGLFIDVPPIDRSPSAIALECEDTTVQARVETWNISLHTGVTVFMRETPQANLMLFSAHTALADILDRPEEYDFTDFTEDDTTDEGGAIWADELHVTNAVHEVMADRMLDM
ncbi:unnamed protein product [Cyclocybe aegerita]|uniref:Uncharacterized protein n=1 Tax=Cyclocybe aegerita TaxID=1973307 RepID=A0A8S0WKP9_CYCAE|nr:unnamed protein product [Cyclocybe aegerita]